MCEISACILKDNEEEKVMGTVEHIEANENTVTLINIFGEKVTMKARFKSYDADNNKILFQPS